MDPRIREHAAIVTNHSVDLQAGDDVVVDAHPVAADLVAALFERFGDVGANPIWLCHRGGARARRAYLRAAGDAEIDGDDGVNRQEPVDEEEAVPSFETPAHEHAMIESTDVHVSIRAGENLTETSDVDPATTSAYRRARRPIMDERLSKRWVLTQYPAPANAQLAEMSTEAYENFVWDAVSLDWAAQRDHQAQLVERLEPAAEVRIRSGDETDLTMSVAGNPAVNDTGEHNLPGGEVFTAPVPDSVSGTVLFDKPLYRQGREVTDVHLTFEDGEVVDHDASKNADLLAEILSTDAGARRLGELGIGMNRAIDRFTYNMLFDEKMGDTVHLAVGRAYDDTVGPDNEANQSAVHVDMIVDMNEDSTIELDGEVIQEDGTFVFE